MNQPIRQTASHPRSQRLPPEPFTEIVITRNPKNPTHSTLATPAQRLPQTASISENSPIATPPTSPPQNKNKIVNWLRSLSPIIWGIVVLLVILPLGGRWIIDRSILPPLPTTHQEIAIPIPPQRSHLDQAIVSAIDTAQQRTRTQAQSELDEWITELEPRVDSFLDWYFDYFTQKRLEIAAPVIWARTATTKAIGLSKTAPETAVNTELTQSFQREFTKRVLIPQTAQLRLEVITTAAVDRFVLDLSQELKLVQNKYRIPQGQWERYLDTIATTVSDTEGNLSNLSLKALVGGSGYLAAKPFLVTSIGKIGSKLSSKLGTKLTASASAKLATKTGSSVAAEIGTSLIDPIVGVGILIWDIWDYHHTVAIDRPILRSNIDSYLRSMERSLLDNPETGIMAAIQQLNSSITQHL